MFQIVNIQTNNSFTVNKPVFRIGREPNFVDHLIENTAVSRSHCQIVQRENACFLIDLNSTNHTGINGQHLEPNKEYPLKSGDIIQIANELYRFAVCAAAPAPSVYISFRSTDLSGNPTPDAEMAEELYHALKKVGIHSFCGSISLRESAATDYLDAIEQALNFCKIFVAVGTSRENLTSRWVKQEIKQFRADLYSGVKEMGKRIMLNYCSANLGAHDLPNELRQNQSFTDLNDLVAFIQQFEKKVP